MKRSLPHLAVALAAILPYLGALSCGFALDDYGAILHHQAVRTLDLSSLLTADYWAGYGGSVSGLYRPLTSLSFAVEYRLWGERPAFYHLANLLLHAGNALLLCCLARRLAGARVGLWAGLLFAVHAVHVEAVAGIAGRADLLSSLFVLAGMLAAAKAREGHRRYWIGSPLGLGLGLACKEQAVVLPGLLALVDCLRWRQGKLRRWPWRDYALHGMVIAAYLLVRQAVLGGLVLRQISFLDNPLAHLPAALRWLSAAAVLARYLRLLMVPYPLSADYSYDALPLAGSALSGAVVWAVGLLGAAVLLFRALRRGPSLFSLGAAWVLVALAPVANLLFPIGTIMAERLLYLPSAGFALLLAAAVQATRATVSGTTGLAVGTALVLVHAGHVWQRAADWEDNEALFRAAAEAYPRSARAHKGLGAALLARGDLIGALDSYRQAIAIYPAYAAAYYDLGLVYYELQQYDRALDSYREAARLDPDDPQVWLNAGAASHALGRNADAEAAYLRAIRLRPTYAEAWQNLADTYWEKGEFRRAAAAYQELLRLQPSHPRRDEYEARVRRGESFQ